VYVLKHLFCVDPKTLVSSLLRVESWARYKSEPGLWRLISVRLYF
jgi:hypothetical protein